MQTSVVDRDSCRSKKSGTLPKVVPIFYIKKVMKKFCIIFFGPRIKPESEFKEIWISDQAPEKGPDMDQHLNNPDPQHFYK
jgi:hypothetical protein